LTTIYLKSETESQRCFALDETFEGLETKFNLSILAAHTPKMEARSQLTRTICKAQRC
jgi:hypothetical protein